MVYLKICILRRKEDAVLKRLPERPPPPAVLDTPPQKKNNVRALGGVGSARGGGSGGGRGLWGGYCGRASAAPAPALGVAGGGCPGLATPLVRGVWGGGNSTGNWVSTAPNSPGPHAGNRLGPRHPRTPPGHPPPPPPIPVGAGRVLAGSTWGGLEGLCSRAPSSAGPPTQQHLPGPAPE